MLEEYDKEKAAALIEEGRQLACQLRAETESLKQQIGRVLEGGEDEPPGAREGTLDANILHHGVVAKSFWQFWR